MASEKPVATMEAAFAMQKSLLKSGMKLWAEMAQAVAAATLAAPGLAFGAALVPVRRRVRSNARRLTRL